MIRRLLTAFFLVLLALPVMALDYRSVAVPAAILYDAPSLAGKKLYLIRELTPVEVVVRVGAWTKIRDVEGTLAWIEGRNLAERRTLVVSATTAEIRQSASASASVLAELAKGVAVDYLEPAEAGWVKVRHRDGATGFIRTIQVWGL